MRYYFAIPRYKDVSFFCILICHNQIIILQFLDFLPQKKKVKDEEGDEEGETADTGSQDSQEDGKPEPAKKKRGK